MNMKPMQECASGYPDLVSLQTLHTGRDVGGMLSLGLHSQESSHVDPQVNQTGMQQTHETEKHSDTRTVSASPQNAVEGAASESEVKMEESSSQMNNYCKTQIHSDREESHTASNTSMTLGVTTSRNTERSSTKEGTVTDKETERETSPMLSSEVTVLNDTCNSLVKAEEHQAHSGDTAGQIIMAEHCETTATIAVDVTEKQDNVMVFALETGDQGAMVESGEGEQMDTGDESREGIKENTQPVDSMTQGAGAGAELSMPCEQQAILPVSVPVTPLLSKLALDILSFLQSCDGNKALTEEITEQCGFTNVKGVNPELYNLERSGKIFKVQDSPSVWKLQDSSEDLENLLLCAQKRTMKQNPNFPHPKKYALDPESACSGSLCPHSIHTEVESKLTMDCDGSLKATTSHMSYPVSSHNKPQQPMAVFMEQSKKPASIVKGPPPSPAELLKSDSVFNRNCNNPNVAQNYPLHLHSLTPSSTYSPSSSTLQQKQPLLLQSIVGSQQKSTTGNQQSSLNSGIHGSGTFQIHQAASVGSNKNSKIAANLFKFGTSERNIQVSHSNLADQSMVQSSVSSVLPPQPPQSHIPSALDSYTPSTVVETSPSNVNLAPSQPEVKQKSLQNPFLPLPQYLTKSSENSSAVSSSRPINTKNFGVSSSSKLGDAMSYASSRAGKVSHGPSLSESVTGPPPSPAAWLKNYYGGSSTSTAAETTSVAQQEQQLLSAQNALLGSLRANVSGLQSNTSSVSMPGFSHSRSTTAGLGKAETLTPGVASISTPSVMEVHQASGGSLSSLSSETFMAMNKNPVSALMEWAQARKSVCTIDCVDQRGPSHRPK